MTCMVVHEEGRHIAVGNKAGAVNVIEVAEHLADSSKKDRPIFTTVNPRAYRVLASVRGSHLSRAQYVFRLWTGKLIVRSS